MGKTVSILFSIMILAAGLGAQQEETVERRLERLERENRRINEELKQSREENARLSERIEGLASEAADLRASDGELEKLVNVLGDAYDDPTWSPATKSGKLIRFYGFLRTDIYYNTARANDPIIPFSVLPEKGTTYGADDDQFAIDVRLTRLGIDLNAGKIGSADVTGKLEMDFANFTQGSTESRPAIRIRLAYIDFDWGNWAVRIGQDWDIISPLLPAVHSELLLWGVGNLGDRRAMAQLIYESDATEDLRIKFELAAGFTGAVDGADNDGAPSRTTADGVDSGHPHAQARLGLNFGSWVEGKRAEIGFWGYVAGLETDTKFNGEDHFTPYTVGIDISLPLFASVSFIAEAWYGQALSDVRGNILQDINTATGDEIEGWGGWAEIHWQTTQDFRLAIGASIDDPKDGDLNGAVSGENRELNWTAYISSKLDLGGGLYTGLDVIYWETRYTVTGTADMVRVNYWIQLNF
ncbi:MAG: hypothetical protein H6807_12100 [Planctomycetes bacterium]|nr:hypothetical protein [Planctomycetota bacterium]